MIMIILAIAAPLCLVVVVLGCLNCFMKKKPSFAPFSNPGYTEEGTPGRHNDAFVVDMEPTAQSNESHVVIDPLPDMSKSVSLPPLRPKIVCADNYDEGSALSLLGSYRPFQRDHLTYLNPLGTGWFGQAINSEALRITSGVMKSQVVVKILKDDASKLEENQFIEDIIPFRRLEHPHVMSLLGQCTETKPYLVIVEYASHGNLKNFLQSHKQSIDALMKKNRLLQFCLDAAAGVACIHRHNFVHCDLATRNCLVMSDNTVKVGDYGIAEHLYKEDYFQSNKELLPIRWMAPECLQVEDGTVCSSGKYSKASDMWSFGVFVWEVFSMAERPYDMLTDEAVLQGVVIDREVTLAEIPNRIPFHDRLSILMNECFKEPNERITIEKAHHNLDDMSHEKVETVNDDLDFEQKWNHLIPSTQSRSQSLISEDGSAIALAGSFSSEIPFAADDRVISVTGDEGSKDMPNLLADIDSQIIQTELPKVPSVPDQLTFGDEIIDSSQPRPATPSKDNSENTSSLTQMATSTPLANKTGQNKTSTSSFLTAPNTPSSQYVTAQDGFSGDSSLLDFGSGGQNFPTEEFNTSEENTINEPESNQFEALDGSGMSGGDQNAGLFSDVQKSEEIFSPFEESKSNVDEKSEEKTFANNGNNFDFVNFGNNANESSDLEFGDFIQPVSPKQLDTSFDVLVPSVLSQDENLLTASQPQPFSSQKASLGFLADSGDNFQMPSTNDLQSTDTVTPSQPFPSTAEANVSTGSILENSVAHNEVSMPVGDAASGAGESAKDITSDSLFLGINASSSSNAFSSNNPFSFGDTTSTSSQNAIVMNKSEIDASSSLNSSLVGWDTSFPDGNIGQSFQPDFDQSNGFAQMNQSSDSLSFLGNAESDRPDDKTSLVSSDYSFLDFPAVSDGQTESGETAPVVPDNTNFESLLSGFDPTPVPSFSPSQNSDIFGLSPAPELSSPFGVTTVPDAATNITMETNPQTSASSNPNPFDDFLFDTKSSSSSFHQTPTTVEGDIFSAGLNEGGKFDEGKKNESSPFDLLGLDQFSGSAAPTPSSTDMMQGGDLVSVTPTDKQVGTPYKFDSSPDQSGDESGINCHSMTESMTVPTVVTDSCYASVTDSRNAEATSEEHSKDFLNTSDVRRNLSLVESDSNEGFADSIGNEENLRNKVCDRLIGDESIPDVEEENSDRKSSPDDYDYNNPSDDTSSTSGSEREYICVNPFDTGQPPTFDPDNDKENIDPDYPDKDLSFEDLNEQDLKIVSEIYLSRGVKSPRVFEVPTLETIPEHQPLHCVSEEAIPTPSETSSIGPRDDDIFGSDSYEWDDFYGDPLIGKDDAGLDLGLSQSSLVDHNISNWSVDFDADSQHSNTSSVPSTTLLNRSDSAYTGSKDNKSFVSDQKVQCLSDSEILISKNSKTTPRPSLVASILAKQNNSRFSSPVKASSDKGSFYSLMEDFDFQFDSSQEDSSSPESLGVHDEDKDDIINDADKKSQPHSSQVSSSFFPSPFSSLPSWPHPSPHTFLSSEKSGEDITLDQGMTKQTSQPDANAVSSMDFLGFGGFESSNNTNVPDSAGNPQESTNAATTGNNDLDFSLI